MVDTRLDVDLLADPDRLGDVLAAQAPRWEPGTAHGHHGQSLGWYESQLLRRVDPEGRTIGRFVADEVAAPLGIDFHVGLPDEIGPERLATFVGGRPASALGHLHEINPRMVLALVVPWTLTGRVFRNPPALVSGADINRRDLLRIEMPSVNGTGSARALARVYDALVRGGADLGLAFAYVMNRAGMSVPFDPHDLALRAAVYSALD